MVEFIKARDFVYSNGIMWERALFAYLFQGGSLDHLHQCFACYKNPDNGFGHAMEHDIRCPDSHPLALEYLLQVITRYAIPPGNLFDGTAMWLEGIRNEDGSLSNPPAVLEYPHAPWWNEGGQSIPDSIVGNLTRLRLVTPSLADSTRRWVEKNLTIQHIQEVEWFFMNYHAHDYFMNVNDLPDVEAYREATIHHILQQVKAIPPEQTYEFFLFAPTPDSQLAQAASDELVEQLLDVLESQQNEDGSWHDEHNLPQWYPATTISILYALQQYGRITI